MFKSHKTRREKQGPKRKPASFLYGMLVIMLVAAMGLASCVSTHTPSTPNPPSITYKNITVDEAQQLIQENSNLIILDVRTQQEYDSGHIPNAVLISVEGLADTLGELDKTKPILVYCQSGVRSAQAGQILADNGFSEVYNLEGGIIAWQEAGAAVNHLPIIESLTASEDHVAPASSCQVKCVASDPDGNELSYEWSTNRGSISGNGSIITWTAPDTVGTYTITAVVTDSHGGESKGSLRINVAVNHPPIIEDLIVTPENPNDFKREDEQMKILKGKNCEIECVASDPDKDELSYEWSAETDRWSDAGTISGGDCVVTWTAPRYACEVTITVTVFDSKGGTDTEIIVFEVAPCRCGW